MVLRERIALGDLLADLGFQVVVGVLGLPVAAGDVVVVAEGAVGPDRAAGGGVGKLGNQGPAKMPADLVEQALKGRRNGRFVLHVLLPVALQCGVVRLDRLVGGLNLPGGGHTYQGIGAQTCGQVGGLLP